MTYKIIVDELLNILYTNNFIDIHKANDIGIKIYKLYGYNGLYTIIELVNQRLLENGYSNEYLYKFKEFEILMTINL